jgi:hypothetical protein
MNNIYKLSLLIVTLICTNTAFADVKIKTRQTMSGQTYEGTTYIKGKRQRSERNMGGMEMVDLTQCDLRRGIQLNPKTKTYIVNAFDTGEIETQTVSATAKNDNVVRSGGTVTTTVTVKDTGERKQMFGFTARHLIFTMESVSSPDACTPYKSKMQTDGWYIDAEFYLDCQQNYAMRSYQAGKNGGCQDKYVSKQIGSGKRGYPLYEKMTMFDESGKETYSFVTEVVELSKATLENALFDVPADYREVKDAAQMYQTANASDDDDNGKSSMNRANSAANSGMKLPAQARKNESPAIGAKKPGTVRIGVSVKTGAVGDGVSSADLAAAVQNSFGEYLKGTNIEIVPLEAKLAGSIDGEARNKECDYVLYALASHKKGGGGLGGMFGKVVAPAIGQIGLVNTGSVAGNIAGHAAANAIITAGQVSTSVKSKDEITLEIRLQQTGSGANVLTKQLKNKAKADGQDIISPMIEQAAQAIFDQTGK